MVVLQAPHARLRSPLSSEPQTGIPSSTIQTTQLKIRLEASRHADHCGALKQARPLIIRNLLKYTGAEISWGRDQSTVHLLSIMQGVSIVHRITLSTRACTNKIEKYDCY